jgi:hypothetical protein
MTGVALMTGMAPMRQLHIAGLRRTENKWVSEKALIRRVLGQKWSYFHGTSSPMLPIILSDSRSKAYARGR